MSNTLALQRVQQGDRDTVYIHKCTLSGNYTQASRGNNTGEVLLPNSATNPNAEPHASAASYDRAYIMNGPGGFSAEILPGADGIHWLLKIYGTTPGTELAAAGYPGGLTGDLDILIAFEAKNYR